MFKNVAGWLCSNLDDCMKQTKVYLAKINGFILFVKIEPSLSENKNKNDP